MISELVFSLNSIIHSWNVYTHLVASEIEAGISILEEGGKPLTRVVVVLTPPIEYTYQKGLYWNDFIGNIPRLLYVKSKDFFQVYFIVMSQAEHAEPVLLFSLVVNGDYYSLPFIVS